MLDRFKILIRTVAMHCLHGGSIRLHGFQNIPIISEIKTDHGGSIEIGNHVSGRQRLSLIASHGKMTIGESVSFNRNCIAVCKQKISIGDHCQFGPNVVIYDHDHIFGIAGIETMDFNTGEIIIENNCWIGANVVILRGTHIGTGSVIGAGSIIKGVVPPHSLVTSGRDMNITSIVPKVERRKKT